MSGRNQIDAKTAAGSATNYALHGEKGTTDHAMHGDRLFTVG